MKLVQTLLVVIPVLLATLAGYPAAAQSPSPSNPDIVATGGPKPTDQQRPNSIPSGSAALLRSKESAKRPLPELVTDRPDFTEATEVVGAGVVQMELGVTLDREGPARHLSGGEVLTRIGLTKRLEARIGSDGLVAQRESSQAWNRGMADTDLGLKFSVFGQGHYRPALSVIPILSVPSGTSLFSSHGYETTVKIALSRDLFAGFTLGGNVNLSSLKTDGGRLFQRAYSASLGHELGRGFAGYWEVYRFAPWDDGAGPAWLANSGVTHGLGENAQVDVRVGSRMTSTGPNWFVGAGLAFRRPTNMFRH